MRSSQELVSPGNTFDLLEGVICKTLNLTLQLERSGQELSGTAPDFQSNLCCGGRELGQNFCVHKFSDTLERPIGCAQISNGPSFETNKHGVSNYSRRSLRIISNIRLASLPCNRRINRP